MSTSLETVKRFVAECSAEERQALKMYLREWAPHPLENDWGIDADTILTAIRRSSDLTKRGVRGIIAEAVFETSVLPTMRERGWKPVIPGIGDLPYDAHLERGGVSARIQIKLQRLEKGVPKLFYPKVYPPGTLYVVEVQKTRGGEKTVEGQAVPTRPYRFGEFDILAVNMHPSSRDWRSFRYTLGSWLLPRQDDAKLVEIMQPVAAVPDEVWTADLGVCLGWLETGVKRSVLEKSQHSTRKKQRKLWD